MAEVIYILVKSSVNKKALKKSFWSSLARAIGVGLSVAAGNMIHQIMSTKLDVWSIALFIAALSFFFMWFAEYESERD